MSDAASSLSETGESASSSFGILFICTGNRCRSPVAEAFVRALGRDLPLEVRSAGLLDMDVGAAPEMVQVARDFGLDLSPHRSAALANLAGPEPDLVVGLERMHAAAAVVDAHLPPERVFTLVEIVRLLEEAGPADGGDPVARARAAVAGAHEARRKELTFVPGEDISDPFGGPRDGYVEMTVKVKDLCERLLEGLFGRGHANGGP